ncbi:SpoIIE family protein phosphatase [Zoogloea sp.]|uniref:SpoIIE family protein phosphatase n=1 Tax=Zoogloea sp. TaxID=49181 RepID=UPI0035B458BD
MSPQPAAPDHGHATSFAITLMAHLVVPTFVLDAERRVLIWNHACERLTGIRADEVIGTRDHWRAFYDSPRPCLADLVADNDWTAIDKLYTTHDAPDTPAFGVHAENWCVMPARGERRYLVVDAGPVFDDAGQLVAVVETLRDNTANKLNETKVAEQASILQHHYEEHEREAKMARRILDHQIRTDLIRQAGVRYTVMPATHFSGDLILAARAPDGRLFALLADATGHGLAAAVSVLPVVQEFYRLVEQDESLATMVESINFVLANSLPAGRFVAAAFVCLDEAAHRGEVWVGGIPGVHLLDDTGQVLRCFESRNLPLGVSRDDAGIDAIETLAWTAPARLVLLSDGVIEATGPGGEAFGELRLADALACPRDTDLIARLRDALTAHLDTCPAHDDISVLVIDCPA